MSATRSSQNSSPAAAAGTKRAFDSSSPPQAKRGKTEEHQKTIEETMDGIETIEDDKDVADQFNERSESHEQNWYSIEPVGTKGDDPERLEAEVKSHEDAAANGENGNQNDHKEPGNCGEKNGIREAEKNAFDEVKADAGEVKKAAKEEEVEKTVQITSNVVSVVTDDKREAAIPSSILEKGVIYFFFRSRVGVEDPQGLDDIARSYIVLRPLPIGAKLGEGPLEVSGNARLLTLPKKMLPTSKRDRFLVFVEKANTSVKDLKENFISGSQYSTKTAGTSNVPAVTPIAEGVYAITSTGRESHLAYHITVPEIGEVQKELGLQEKGSYVVSVKNPAASGQVNTNIGKDPEYPEDVIKRFRNLRWLPLEPDFLDYENTQFIIIGEGLGNTNKAMEEQPKDKKDDEKETPQEEIDQLDGENSIRVEHLKGDDLVFADLGLSSKEYPKLQTTW